MLAALLLIIIVLATGFLLMGQQRTSSSYRSITRAQAIATAEIAQLRAQAGASGTTGTFPPSDTDTNSSWSPGGSNLTATATYADGALDYSTYVVGGWCMLATSTPTTVNSTAYGASDWTTYSSSSYSMSNPPAYWVGVVVTWGVHRNTQSLGVSAGYRAVFTDAGSPSVNRLVLVSAVAAPLGTTPPTSSTACPAELS
jgi:hypothetical protein